MKAKEILNFEHNLNHIKDPEFEKAGRVHDWRNYVPDKLKENWDELTEESRACIYLICDTVAGEEHWD